MLCNGGVGSGDEHIMFCDGDRGVVMSTWRPAKGGAGSGGICSLTATA
jgi:hypothetical protein